MRDAWILLTGTAFMGGSVALVKAFGHPIMFFGGTPRWWVLPLTGLSACAALALGIFAARRGRDAAGRRIRWSLHLLTVGLFGAFVSVPLFWVLAASVGTFSLVLFLPYDLAIAAMLVLGLRRVGVLG